MVPTTRRWLVATTTVVLTALAGCSTITSGSAAPVAGGGSAGAGDASSSGSDTGSSTDGGTGDGGGGGTCSSGSGFCITVAISGATTLQGTAERISLGTCADFAKGPTSGGELHLPGLLGDIGGKKITALNEISPYTGPGTYEKDTLKSVAGVLDISIDSTPYQSADNTSAQAVINADGSGSLTFTDLKADEGNSSSPKGVISGNVTWTCSD